MLHAFNRDSSFGALKQDGAGEKPMDGVAFLIFVIFGGIIYFVPTIVAFVRDHEYRWVLLALNAIGGWTFVFWAATLIWAVFPRDKLFVDPLVGAAVGAKNRNVGDLTGEVEFGRERGYHLARDSSALPSLNMPSQQQQPIEQTSLLDILERLQRLRDSGTITAEEFDAQKREAMRRHSPPF